jgi:DNA-binding NarL/FixJ family response regulator
MRCLIVDDDESPRTLMHRLIAAAGHRVVAVRTGAQALAALEQEQYDVALVDLELPGMSGADAITAMRRLAPQLRVLVVSGHDDRKHVLAAFAAGADGYLLKDELADSLGRALQDVRAGHSPLSPRVAAVVVRHVRARGTASPPVAAPQQQAQPLARLRSPSGTGADKPAWALANPSDSASAEAPRAGAAKPEPESGKGG